MGSDRPPPQSLKINPYAATSPPSFPKPEPVVIELPTDDLIDAGGTRPIHVQSIHNPGMAAPFTPAPPPARPEPMLPPATPVPTFATLQSAAFQQQMPPQSQGYPEVQSFQQPMMPQQNPNMYPSYAPTAMDIAMQQAYATPPPKKSRTGLILGVVFGLGFLFVLGLGGAGFAYYKLRMAVDETVQAAAVQNDPTPAATTASTSTSTSAADVKKADTFDPPPLATNDSKDAKVAPPVVTTKPATTTNTWKPAATPKVTTAKTEPKVDVKKDDAKVESKKDDAKTDAKDDNAASAGGTGTVRSFNAEAGKPIMVDGNMAGVAPAPFTVACGPHKIQVGSEPVKNVNVPCNGAVTVGSPDGQ